MSYNQKEQFSAIAEAIRGKDGTTDAIAAKDFAARIAAIPTGGKIYTTTVTVTSKNNGARGYPFTVTGIGFTPTSVLVFAFDSNTSFTNKSGYTLGFLFTGEYAYCHEYLSDDTYLGDFYSSLNITFGDGTFSFAGKKSSFTHYLANLTYFVIAWQD